MLNFFKRLEKRWHPMAEITITRTNMPMPTDEELSGARKVLFECLRGVSDDDNRAWRRLWKKIINFAPGEISFLDFVIPRNSKFHRKFFALLAVGFDAWEPARKRKSYKGIAMEKNPEQFREDIIILAGFYEQTFDLRGKMILRAKSMKFAKIDNEEFENLYQAVVTVLLREVCHHYKDRAELDSVVDRVIGFA